MNNEEMIYGKGIKFQCIKNVGLTIMYKINVNITMKVQNGE